MCICLRRDLLGFPVQIAVLHLWKTTIHLLVIIVPHDRGGSTPCARRSSPFGDVIEYTTCVLSYLASSMSVDCTTIGIFNELHCYILTICSPSISFLRRLLVHCSRLLRVLRMFLPNCFVPEFHKRVIGYIKSRNCLRGKGWYG